MSANSRPEQSAGKRNRKYTAGEFSGNGEKAKGKSPPVMEQFMSYASPIRSKIK